MILQDLCIPSDHLNPNSLFREWAWLLGEEPLTLLLVTRCGDAFLQKGDSGAIFFLDTQEGVFEAVADDLADFSDLLDQEEMVPILFSLELLAPVWNEPMPADHVYSFKKHPILGGENHSDNLSLVPLQTHLDVTGLLWSQVNDIMENMENDPDWLVQVAPPSADNDKSAEGDNIH